MNYSCFHLVAGKDSRQNQATVVVFISEKDGKQSLQLLEPPK